MGLRENVALLLLAVILQTALTEGKAQAYINPFQSNKKLRNVKCSYNGFNDSPSYGITRDIYTTSPTTKTFNFPEVIFPTDANWKDSFNWDETKAIQPKQSSLDNPALSNFRKDARRKRKSKQLKRNMAQEKIQYEDPKLQPNYLANIGVFPEVEYPLSIMDTWTPSYWNTMPFHNTEDYFKSEDIPYTVTSDKTHKHVNVPKKIAKQKGGTDLLEIIRKANNNHIKEVTSTQNDTHNIFSLEPSENFDIQSKSKKLPKKTSQQKGNGNISKIIQNQFERMTELCSLTTSGNNTENITCFVNEDNNDSLPICHISNSSTISDIGNSNSISIITSLPLDDPVGSILNTDSTNSGTEIDLNKSINEKGTPHPALQPDTIPELIDSIDDHQSNILGSKMKMDSYKTLDFVTNNSAYLEIIPKEHFLQNSVTFDNITNYTNDFDFVHIIEGISKNATENMDLNLDPLLKDYVTPEYFVSKRLPENQKSNEEILSTEFLSLDDFEPEYIGNAFNPKSEVSKESAKPYIPYEIFEYPRKVNNISDNKSDKYVATDSKKSDKLIEYQNHNDINITSQIVTSLTNLERLVDSVLDYVYSHQIETANTNEVLGQVVKLLSDIHNIEKDNKSRSDLIDFNAQNSKILPQLFDAFTDSNTTSVIPSYSTSLVDIYTGDNVIKAITAVEMLNNVLSTNDTILKLHKLLDTVDTVNRLLETFSNDSFNISPYKTSAIYLEDDTYRFAGENVSHLHLVPENQTSDTVHTFKEYNETLLVTSDVKDSKHLSHKDKSKEITDMSINASDDNMFENITFTEPDYEILTDIFKQPDANIETLPEKYQMLQENFPENNTLQDESVSGSSMYKKLESDLITNELTKDILENKLLTEILTKSEIQLNPQTINETSTYSYSTLDNTLQSNIPNNKTPSDTKETEILNHSQPTEFENTVTTPMEDFDESSINIFAKKIKSSDNTEAYVPLQSDNTNTKTYDTLSDIFENSVLNKSSESLKDLFEIIVSPKTDSQINTREFEKLLDISDDIFQFDISQYVDDDRLSETLLDDLMADIVDEEAHELVNNLQLNSTNKLNSSLLDCVKSVLNRYDNKTEMKQLLNEVLLHLINSDSTLREYLNMSTDIENNSTVTCVIKNNIKSNIFNNTSLYNKQFNEKYLKIAEYNKKQEKYSPLRLPENLESSEMPHITIENIDLVPYEVTDSEQNTEQSDYNKVISDINTLSQTYDDNTVLNNVNDGKVDEILHLTKLTNDTLSTKTINRSLPETHDSKQKKIIPPSNIFDIEIQIVMPDNETTSYSLP